MKSYIYVFIIVLKLCTIVYASNNNSFYGFYVDPDTNKILRDPYEFKCNHTPETDKLEPSAAPITPKTVFETTHRKKIYKKEESFTADEYQIINIPRQDQPDIDSLDLPKAKRNKTLTVFDETIKLVLNLINRA